MTAAPIEPRAPVAPPAGAGVDPAGRSRRDRPGPRDGRRPRPRPPAREADEEPEAPAPAPGRIDILA
jgi:hypothetical protein